MEGKFKGGCNGKAGSQWRGLMALCEDVGQAQELVGDCVFYLCFLFVSVEKFLGVGVVEAILHSGGKEIRPHSLLSRSTMGRDRIWADETCCLGSEGLTKKKKNRFSHLLASSLHGGRLKGKTVGWWLK